MKQKSVENKEMSEFEKQYLKYNEILDIDHEKYMVMYTCQESAKYLYLKTNDYFPEEYVITRSRSKFKNPKGSDIPHTYKFDKEIKQEMFHRESVKIYWRPKLTLNRQWLYDENKIDKTKVEELLNKIDELLPKLKVK